MRQYQVPCSAVVLACVLSLPAVLPATASGRALPSDSTGNPLVAASGSIEALVRSVSGSVVQVVVTGYRPLSEPDGGRGASVGRGRSIGSGAVVDAGGYIVTNAHVVTGAERIDVVLAPGDDGETVGDQAPARVVPAELVGVAEDWDLALLKVNVAGLRPLPLADYAQVRQGQLVFAFGSPDGLRNSVTMGMVSSVARQIEPDSPLVYIQTDAAINPGNSGGPLVNAFGEVIGLNTFIRSASGGSDGLGFALPSSLVAAAWPQLRDYGHLRRAVIGLATQTVTPTIAAGLHLPSAGGLLVSDVAADGPAAVAGFRPGDVVTAIDGERVDNTTMASLYLHLAGLAADRDVHVEARRGDRVFSATLRPVELPRERTGVIDTASMAVDALAILGVPAPGRGTLGPGVLIAARLDTPHAADIALAVGDVIHAVNGAATASVAELREAVGGVARGGAVVLQVERSGRLTYLAFERD